MSQPNFSRPGAIDLSSLRQPPARPGGPGGPGAPARPGGPGGPGAGGPGGGPGGPGGGGVTGPYVLTVSEQSFQTDVIERSVQHPVVVEFWSPRSEASVALGPVLARLTTEYGGKFLLARIDVDANPQLAQAVGVQSIPLVIAVLRGQVVPLFQGALGEPEARQYLDQLLTVAVANGITGRAEPVGPAAPAEQAEPALDPRYEAAENAVAAGDLDGAITAYETLLKETPNDAEAKAGLARVQLVKRTRDVPAEVRTRAADNPTDIEAQLLVADVDLMGGHVEDAFARLIRTIQSTAGDERNTVRLHLLELFEVVGGDDERVIKARRQLMTALF
ncbi:Thioredoxin domain protein [Kribbella flavida DSM 17836]|uniref:Thioredoxin domain protein n=1 Tax=Kribbella flavida (strain DSM 17836 / JCM 10339 / NBRC 14399) TaxID=479435 RepID=D2Q245_KRIFD|nr:tetratricopeptide repeat protein [Kribbella flavida]ADB33991.1 Thioredoxin domain protein [Kribbella flavida DSM 17836]